MSQNAVKLRSEEGNITISILFYKLFIYKCIRLDKHVRVKYDSTRGKVSGVELKQNIG